MNEQAMIPQKQKFSVAISTPGYKKLIANTLTDPKRQAKFIAAITSAVGINPALQECDSKSIIAGALLGESLNLSPSPQLGQYYLVPFKQKEKRDRAGNVIEPACTKATFVLGYKGMLQLALRSGAYEKLTVLEIKEGEFKGYDPLNEEIDVKIITNPNERQKKETVGYYAMFEYHDGYKKKLYWTKEQMMHHADRYSKAFSAEDYERIQRGEVPEKDMWKYSSYWYTDFDGMAKKTMLRQLISHWGDTSAENIRVAVESDGESMTLSDGDIILPETPEELPEPETTTEEPTEAQAEESVDISDL